MVGTGDPQFDDDSSSSVSGSDNTKHGTGERTDAIADAGILTAEAVPVGDCFDPPTERKNAAKGAVNTEAREAAEDNQFQKGDHVYRWCSHGVIQKAYMHHGIVVSVVYVETAGDGPMAQSLVIADFSALLHEDKSSSCGANILGQEGVLRLHINNTSDTNFLWRKVKYEEWFLGNLVSGAGTSTSAKSSPMEEVMKRVNFLLTNSHVDADCIPDFCYHNFQGTGSLLPEYHVLYANCECVARWCKTGTWATLQVKSVLASVSSGSALGAGALGVAEATVPATGLWGTLGFTTTVSAAVAFPALLCGTVAGGVASTGTYVHAKIRWSKIENTLNAQLRFADDRKMIEAWF